MFVGNARQNGATDYDEEAKKLWARLDTQPASRFNNLDPLHRSQEGGFIYVGGDLVFSFSKNTFPLSPTPLSSLSSLSLLSSSAIIIIIMKAARDLKGLQARGVTAVVNCTTNIECFHKGVLEYLTFDISRWRWDLGRSYGPESDQSQLIDFLRPVLKFISEKIFLGESVLVHCLAGAHRAGTTGIISLMHFQGLDSSEAIKRAKSRRPIIEPIGDFRMLLSMCDAVPRDEAGQFKLS